MADFVAVPVGSEREGAPEVVSAALFQAVESDLVTLRGGGADVEHIADTAAGRLEAIADAAEDVYRSLQARLKPDEVEMEISVGLSGEVGWFVAKSSATGGLKLTLTWKSDSTQP